MKELRQFCVAFPIKAWLGHGRGQGGHMITVPQNSVLCTGMKKKYTCTFKYKFCNSGDFTLELNALMFAFEAGIVKCKDEW